jgi:hypothetical protein
MSLSCAQIFLDSRQIFKKVCKNWDFHKYEKNFKKPAKNSRQKSWPAVEWRQGGGLVWLIFPTAYSFLMISPNLHAIWVFFLLNLSQELKSVILLYFGTLGTGYSLKGSKK